MKVVFLIVQLVIVTTAVTDRCGNGVKDPYPGDNTKFIICENHIPLAKKCPNGMIFNSKVQVCEISDNAVNNPNYARVIETSHSPLVAETVSSYARSASTNDAGQYQRQHQNPNYDSATVLTESNYQNSIPIGGNGYNGGDSSKIGISTNAYGGQSLGSGHSQQHFDGTDQAYSGVATSQSHVITSGQSGYNTGQSHTVPSVQPGYSGITQGRPGYSGLPAVQPGYSSATYIQSGRPGEKTKPCTSCNSGIGGGYNDHKNTNWESEFHQKNNHQGLDQNHVNLNVISGSTGYSADCCKGVSVGGHISFPGDCTKFIVCMEDGEIVPKNCPPGTHFNAKLEICDWPAAAGCHY